MFAALMFDALLFGQDVCSHMLLGLVSLCLFVLQSRCPGVFFVCTRRTLLLGCLAHRCFLCCSPGVVAMGRRTFVVLVVTARRVKLGLLAWGYGYACRCRRYCLLKLPVGPRGLQRCQAGAGGGVLHSMDSCLMLVV